MMAQISRLLTPPPILFWIIKLKSTLPLKVGHHLWTTPHYTLFKPCAFSFIDFILHDLKILVRFLQYLMHEYHYLYLDIHSSSMLRHWSSNKSNKFSLLSWSDLHFCWISSNCNLSACNMRTLKSEFKCKKLAGVLKKINLNLSRSKQVFAVFCSTR